ncbi:MAG: hypothetical protein QOD53_1917 [Thermoleophilaceae bacterium]|jgi:hypothetical protein|nr:hypothetical protein [Thermoleophilaceae bacterium]
MSRASLHRLLGACVAAALLAVVPAAAQAKRVKFGSKLTAPANRSEAHGSDSVFWSTDLPGKTRFRVPRKGRVMTIRIKGTALRNGPKPLAEFHFQILHPAHGKVHVKLTSGPFDVPVGGDPNQITTYHPVNLCARKRDFVAFNDEGGYNPPKYPQGTPFQIFSTSTGASTAFFNGPSGNGASFKGSKRSGEELLMQMTVGTGADAGICPH